MSAVATPARRPFLDVSLSAAMRYWYRNAVVFRRTWLIGVIAWFLEPVIYLVGMGTGLSKYLQQVQGIDYIDFIAPGLMAVSAMYGATFETTWSAFFKMDRQGTYAAASATPLSVEDVGLGEMLWGTTRALIYGSAFAAVAMPFGVFHSWLGLLIVPALALVGLVFSVLGLSYAYLCKRIDYLSYYWTLFLTPMFMFAGIFFPLTRLPDWVQTLAWLMPLKHSADLMRALMLTADVGDAARAALWLVAVSAGLFWVPLRILRHRLAS